MRRRLVVLAVFAALIAPWAAPCLLSASGDEAMPCCTMPDSNAPPTVRPCCAPVDQQPATSSPTAVASVFHAVPASCYVTPFGDRVTALSVALFSKPVPTGVSLRSTVLLI